MIGDYDLPETLSLSEVDRRMLDGGHGPGAQLAMRIITRMAAIQGASTLLDIEAAHIDSSLYMGQATLDFAERLVELGARVQVPSTLNVSGVDEAGWKDWAVPPEWAQQSLRQMQAYQAMGCIPTWTCAPYQSEHRPRFGQQIAWGESNAIAFANSVIGARSERYPDLMDICAAITGRAPAVGLHLTEGRAGQVLVTLVDVPLAIQRSDIFYPVLGHILGQVSGDQNPVVSGLEVEPDEDQLKSLGAAAASSGSVGMFHLVGITPEAPTEGAAFQGKKPGRSFEIGMPQLRQALGELSTAEGEQLDMVVLGSPHYSLAEFERLASMLDGRQRHPRVEFLVTSSRAMCMLAERAGHLEALRSFGGRVTVDTCILTTPMLPENIKLLMTNSAKYAYYAPGLLGTQVVFGSLEDCVNSAAAGSVMRERSLWQA
jgi:predicted aconitase